jgi:dinuclear metal center YbgI/SA1388 family protein
MISLNELVAALDDELRTREVPDYGGAMNGLQVANRGTVARLAVAVDFSRGAIDGAIAAGASLLVVHHGMFWSGAQPIVGAAYDRMRLLLEHDIAVYSSHLPLDAHPTLGNNVRLAAELGLVPNAGFARYKTIDVGVAGESDVATPTLAERAGAFATAWGGTVRTTPIAPGHRTRRWAICTGAGASSDTLREASERGIDTLIVGEGPHHTAVEAVERGVVVIYAGHYATETLGVRAVGGWVEERFGVRWGFVGEGTGL